MIIASQLPPEYAGIFRNYIPSDVEIIDIPRGLPQIGPGIEVLIAMPMGRAGDALNQPPPPGWPFDLKWTQLLTVGLDYYPQWFLEGALLTQGTGRSSIALAEFALAAMFAFVKRMPGVWIEEAARWQRMSLDSLDGATLGIVGFGGLGRTLAMRAAALGMKVVAVRRSDRDLPPGIVRMPDLPSLFAASDHVVLAAPGTAENRHMIDDHVLAAAKPGLHLVNMARGLLIDDAALLRALDDGRIALASLDAVTPEPLPTGHVYYTHPRVRLSPHTSTNTPDHLEALAANFAANLARFRAGQPLMNDITLSTGAGAK